MSNIQGCIVLLDGLDEEPDQNIRKQMVDVTNAVLHHWEDNLFVLSSRPFGYHAVAALEKMATAHIASFGRDEILEFLIRCRNPCSLSKVMVQRLCLLSGLLLQANLSCPPNSMKGVTDEPFSKIITDDMALPVPYCLDAEI